MLLIPLPMSTSALPFLKLTLPSLIPFTTDTTSSFPSFLFLRFRIRKSYCISHPLYPFLPRRPPPQLQVYSSSLLNLIVFTGEIPVNIAPAILEAGVAPPPTGAHHLTISFVPMHNISVGDTVRVDFHDAWDLSQLARVSSTALSTSFPGGMLNTSYASNNVGDKHVSVTFNGSRLPFAGKAVSISINRKALARVPANPAIFYLLLRILGAGRAPRRLFAAGLGRIEVEPNAWTVETAASLAAPRVAQRLCPKGFFCNDGRRTACPVGVYGTTEGLYERGCTEMCTAGTYCPLGSVDPIVCDAGHYCPNGQDRIACPAGTYGATSGLGSSSCTGLCTRGYYCPEGSTSTTQIICPAGRYGATDGLATGLCSGECDAGYYCPEGSTSFKQIACGGAHLFCPVGSSQPIRVGLGNYTEYGDYQTRHRERTTERGYYSLGYSGLRRICEAGSYGASEGLAINTCTGQCDPGYYCPAGSIAATAVKCPAGRFGARACTNATCSGLCDVSVGRAVNGL